MDKNKKRPFEVYLLCAFILFISAGAFYGGGSMILTPDGSLLKMDGTWLEMLPFPDFLIPGIILFTMLGIFPLLAVIGLFTRKQIAVFNRINIFTDKHWGWTFSLYTGIISLFWIIFQQLMTAYFILQPIIGLAGLLIIITSLLPRVQRYYTVSNG